MLVDWAETGQPVYTCYNQTWIGLIRKDIPGVFQWTDGTPVDYVNWMGDMPHISPSSCVGLCTDDFIPGTGSGLPDKYMWFDDWLTLTKRASICQKPARQ
ncbi:hypothetical protein AAVH_08109 [Aphelenchoides avenae]|nr:hypothetical protein AAVH_08109 [Aphelenchus avenae]